MWKNFLQFVFSSILVATGIVLISSYNAESKLFVAGNTILGGVAADIVKKISGWIISFIFMVFKAFA